MRIPWAIEVNLSTEINKNTHQVTSAADLEAIWFKGKKNIGISAGASTPDYLIKEVEDKIKIIYKDELWKWELLK